MIENTYQHPHVKFSDELAHHLSELNDFNQNLEAEYSISTYNTFERKFRNIRFEYKKVLFGIDNEYNEYIVRSELRKEQVNRIIQFSHEVAKVFQDARKNDHLDRVECTDRLENLIVAIQNLRALIKGQELN